MPACISALLRTKLWVLTHVVGSMCSNEHACMCVELKPRFRETLSIGRSRSWAVLACLGSAASSSLTSRQIPSQLSKASKGCAVLLFR